MSSVSGLQQTPAGSIQLLDRQKRSRSPTRTVVNREIESENLNISVVKCIVDFWFWESVPLGVSGKSPHGFTSRLSSRVCVEPFYFVSPPGSSEGSFVLLSYFEERRGVSHSESETLTDRQAPRHGERKKIRGKSSKENWKTKIIRRQCAARTNLCKRF